MKKPLLKSLRSHGRKGRARSKQGPPRGRQPYDTDTYQFNRDTCDLKSKVIYSRSGRRPEAVECRNFTPAEILQKSREYMDLLTGKNVLTRKRKQEIIRRTLENFENFYNRGFLIYRKSVAEAADFAALEWDGRGSIMRDLLGRSFIDCLGGYGIYNMGMCHPKIISAVEAQLKRMPLSSQELLDPWRGALAELLGGLAPGSLQECFFINNGTDAVEGALKLARLYTKKVGFISAVNGFHGKSMGSLSVMGKHVYRRPFEPLLPHVHFVPFGDTKSLEQEFKKLKTVGEDIAALILEPVQGEAGAIVPPDDYLRRARELCTDHGVLLILDEVQTGFGRTGKIFACEHWNVVPDILCLGKSIGGGVMPLSAFISNSRIWKVMEDNPFIHSSTFGGNPLACAAGIAAINVMLEEKLAEQAAEKGEYFMTHLKEFRDRFPEILRDVHGLGLLIGLDFATNETGYQIASGLFRRRVLVAGTLISSRTIRIEPALNIPKNLIDEVLDRLEDCLKEISRHARRNGQKKTAKK
jgi:putrescine aminotransferase